MRLFTFILYYYYYYSLFFSIKHVFTSESKLDRYIDSEEQDALNILSSNLLDDSNTFTSDRAIVALGCLQRHLEKDNEDAQIWKLPLIKLLFRLKEYNLIIELIFDYPNFIDEDIIEENWDSFDGIFDALTQLSEQDRIRFFELIHTKFNNDQIKIIFYSRSFINGLSAEYYVLEYLNISPRLFFINFEEMLCAANDAEGVRELEGLLIYINYNLSLIPNQHSVKLVKLGISVARASIHGHYLEKEGRLNELTGSVLKKYLLDKFSIMGISRNKVHKHITCLDRCQKSKGRASDIVKELLPLIGLFELEFYVAIYFESVGSNPSKSAIATFLGILNEGFTALNFNEWQSDSNILSLLIEYNQIYQIEFNSRGDCQFKFIQDSHQMDLGAPKYFTMVSKNSMSKELVLYIIKNSKFTSSEGFKGFLLNISQSGIHLQRGDPVEISAENLFHVMSDSQIYNIITNELGISLAVRKETDIIKICQYDKVINLGELVQIEISENVLHSLTNTQLQLSRLEVVSGMSVAGLMIKYICPLRIKEISRVTFYKCRGAFVYWLKGPDRDRIYEITQEGLMEFLLKEL